MPSSRFLSTLSRNRPLFLAALLFAAAGLGLLSTLPAQADGATFYVNPGTGLDTNDCSNGSPCKTIQKAVTAAGEDDTIVLAGGVYSPASGESFPITVDKNLTFAGAGETSTSINASGSGQRVFVLNSGLTVTMSGLTLRGGSAGAGGGGAIYADDVASLELMDVTVRSSTAYHGGGLYLTGGSLALTNATFLANTASQDGGAVYKQGSGAFQVENSTFGLSTGANSAQRGGGIFLVDSPLTLSGGSLAYNSAASAGAGLYANPGSASVTLTAVSISNNTAGGLGGGLYLGSGTLALSQTSLSGNSAATGAGVYQAGGSLSLVHSLLSANAASVDGGGLAIAGGSTTIDASTFSANSASGTGGSGGAIYKTGGTALVLNSATIAGNTAVRSDRAGLYLAAGTASASSSLFSGNACSGTIADDGTNLDSGASCVVTAGRNDKSDLLLGPLAGNGGPTYTHALGLGSSAIDSGSCTGTQDQRGFERPSGATCDVGAFEFVRPAITFSGGALDYTEGDGPVVVDDGALLEDDAAGYASGALSITLGETWQTDDLLSIGSSGPISTSGEYVIYTGGIPIIIGSFSGGTDVDHPLLVNLNASANPERVQALLRAVTFENVSSSPDETPRTASFQLADGQGAASETASRAINVARVNFAPQVSDFSRAMPEDTGISFTTLNFSGHFSDEDGDSLARVKIASLPAHGRLALAGGFVGLNQEIEPGDLPDLTYMPDENYYGADSFDWNASDGTVYSVIPATVYLMVNPVNDLPSVADFSKTTDEDTAIEDTASVSFTVSDFTGSFSDPDTGDSLQAVKITGLPQHGALVLKGVPDQPLAENDEIPVDSLGSLKYTPFANYNGPDSFTWKGKDNNAYSTLAAAVTISVTAVNDAPVNTLPGAQSLDEDGSLVFSGDEVISIADPDAGGSDIQVQLTAANGTLALSGTAGLTISGDGDGTASMTLTGALDAVNAALEGMTFTPTGDYSGPASVQIAASDLGSSGAGGEKTDTDTVEITVSPVNDAPVFSLSGDSPILEDAGEQTINLSGISAGGGEVGQTITVIASSSNTGIVPHPAVSYTSPDAAGSLTFTPVQDAHGEVTITVTVSDDGGTANGGDDATTDSFVLVIDPVNDPPTLDDPADMNLSEDAPQQTVDLSGISAGGAETQPLTVTATSSNTGIVPDPAVSYTSPDMTGSLTFTPVADANGAATITVEVSDGVAQTTQEFTVSLAAVNDAPSFGGSDVTRDEDAGAVTVAGWAGTISPGPADESGQMTGFTVSSDNNDLFSVQPGVDDASGGLTFTPAGDAYGTAAITVTLTDDGGTANGGVDALEKYFSITIDPVDDPPTLDDPADMNLSEDAPQQTVDLSGISAGGAETQPLTVTATSSNTAIIPHPAVSYTSPDATGSLTFTPVADANGAATITVEASDGAAAIIREFTVSVAAVDDTPSFTRGDNQTLNEDAGEVVVAGWASSISNGGADEAGQTLAFDVTGNTNPGLFSAGPDISPAGDLSFTPSPDANGTAAITVTLTDGGLTSAGQEFSLTVRPVNDAPSFSLIAEPDQTASEDSGAQAVAGLATNISTGPADEAGQEPSFIVTNDNNSLFASQPAIDSGGGLAYTPAPNAHGAATVTVVLTDDGGTDYGGVDASAAQTFTITVDPVNDAPVQSVPGAQSTDEDTPLTFSSANGNRILVADDSGSEPIQVTLTAENGTFSLSGGGVTEASRVLNDTLANINAALNGLVFTPEADFSGEAGLEIQTDDLGSTGGGPLTDSDSVSITVSAVNDAPVLHLPDEQVILEDTGLVFSEAGAGLISITDVDAGSSPISVTLTAGHGALSLSGAEGLDFTTGDGTADASLAFTAALADANSALDGLTFTPEADYNGTGGLSLQVSDLGNTGGGGHLTASGSVSIDVTPVNDPPSFSKGADQTVAEDAGPQSVPAWATAISPGPGDESGQILAFSLTVETNPGLFATPPAVSPDGTLTYTPAPDTNGSAQLSLSLSDDGGTAGGGLDTSAPQTFTITVTPVNDAPVLVSEPDLELGAILEDVGSGDNPGILVSDLLLGRVTDADAGALTGIAVISSEDSGGAWQYATDGGESWSAFGPTAEDSALLLPAAARLRFAPEADFNGTASISLRAWDRTAGADGGTADTTTSGGSSPFSAAAALASITVTPVNDAPVLNGSPSFTLAAIPEDAGGGLDNPGLSISDLIASAGGDPITDADSGALPGIAVVGIDGSGGAWQYSTNGGSEWSGFGSPTAASARLLAAEEENRVRFVPGPDFNGAASLSLRAWDRTDGSSGGTADTTTNGGATAFSTAAAPASITVTPVNDPPSFSKGADQTVAEDAGPQSVPAWATAISPGPGDESGQILAFSLTVETNPGLFATPPAVSPDGTLTYTPAPDANGSAQLSLSLSDDGGTAGGGLDTFAPQTFTITVTPVNDAPSFTGGVDLQVEEDDGDLVFAAWATGISAGPGDETGQTLSFILTNDNNGLFASQPAISPEGDLTFGLAPGASGSAQVTVTLQDDGGTADGGADTSGPQTFTISVAEINDPPVHTAPAAQSTDEDTPLVFSGGSGNPISVADDAGENPLQVSLAVDHGSLSLSGTDGLSFIEGDGAAGATLVFTGTLSSINTALDGLTFTPEADYSGEAGLEIQTNDLGHSGSGGEKTDSDTVAITVNAVNDAPALSLPGGQDMLEDSTLVFSLANGYPLTVSDVDAGSSPISVTLTAGQGVISLSDVEGLDFTTGDGSNDAALAFTAALADANSALDGLTFTPEADFNGSAGLSLQVSDQGHTGGGGSLTASGSVAIQVLAVNDPPSFTKGPDLVLEEDAGPQTYAAWTTDISKGPADEDGQPLDFVITGNTNPLLFSAAPAVSASGDLTFTPAPNAFGLATIRLILQDGGGGLDSSDEQSFTITVNSVNDAPILLGETALLLDEILEDTPIGENPGTLVSDLLASGGGRVSDGDNGALEGIAVTGVDNTGGFWQYSTNDGASWASFGSPGESSARLLAAAARLRFVPNANFNGTASLSLRAWDRTSGGSGGTADTTANGGATAFSAQVLPAQIAIQSVNDLPTDLELSSTAFDENLAAGALIGTFTSTDVDGSSFTYSLVEGEGSEDNGAFAISGDQLLTDAVFDYEAKSSYTIRVETDDGQGGLYSEAFSLAVQDVNDVPTGLSLSVYSVPENQPSATVVGGFTTQDQDAADTHTYSLVEGEGSGDNGAFTISGDQLLTGASFDFETQDTYNIRVQTGDGRGGLYAEALAISVANVNEAPTGLSLSSLSIAENQPSGTTVGLLTADDPDAGDGHTFSLVAGTGGADNAFFDIVGDELKTQASFNFEGKTSYAIRIQASDGLGGIISKAFTISVTNLNENPVGLNLSGSTIAENLPAGSTVGTLSSVDPDAGSSFTYSLVEGEGSEDNGAFAIDGSELKTAEVFDFETRDYYNVRIQTSDGLGGALQRTFTIFIADANDAPSALSLDSASLVENEDSGTAIGRFSTTDQDLLDTHEYTLVEGEGSTDNASFTIAGDELRSGARFDHEGKSSYTIRVRTGDGRGGVLEQPFTILVTDANDAPTGISLSGASLPENQPGGALVGALTTADQDAGDSHGYALVAGEGDADNAAFTIDGSQLKAASGFDYEDRQSYQIRVQAQDSGGLTIEQAFTIAVTDVNEAPTGLSLSAAAIAEDAITGAAVGTFTTQDPDAGDSFTYSLVAGEGDEDNASFDVAEDRLVTAASFDFETRSAYSVRVRVSDSGGLAIEQAFAITILDAAEAPTAIYLSQDLVAENQPVGTLVGVFDSQDDDAGSSFTYSLVAGDGDSGNGAFAIDGSSLRTAAPLNYEETSTLPIRVRTTDNQGEFFEQPFTILVQDLNDAPTDLSLSSASLAENQGEGAVVGVFSSVDQDSADTHTYNLISGGADNAAFTIDGGQLKAASSFDYEVKSSYAIRVRTHDGRGGTFDRSFTITVVDLNEAPTALSLSATSLPENGGAGAEVAHLSTTDPDLDQTHTYSLAVGEGDADNRAFQVSGDRLLASANLDFETQEVYHLRLQTSDGEFSLQQEFTITLTDVNEAPTAIHLSSATIDESQPAGTTIGTLSAEDQDAGDTHTFELVDGPGGEDNASFEIVADALKTAAALDYDTHPLYSIRIQASDQEGAAYQQVLTITVTDVNDVPTGLELDSASVDENLPAGTLVGGFITTDADSGDEHSYTFVDGDGCANQAAFQIEGDSLLTAVVLDHESTPTLKVCVRSDDQRGGTIDRELTITVEDVNESPTGFSLSNTQIGEDELAATVVGTFTTSDPDVSETFTYTLAGGLSDNAAFTIDGSSLKTAGPLDFETKPAYTIRVEVSDGEFAIQEEFTITVVDLNDAPTAIHLSSAAIDENLPAGAVVAAMTTDDQDTGSTHTYELVEGQVDNDLFTASGDQLLTAASFDFEAQTEYQILLQTSDGLLTLQQAFTITVNDVNEAPTGLSLSGSAIDENQPAGSLVGTFTTDDPDTSGTHTYTLVEGDGCGGGQAFQIDGSRLETQAVLDYEEQDEYTLCIQTSDGEFTLQQAFTITIIDGDEPPLVSALELALAEDGSLAFDGTEFSGAYQDVEDSSLVRVKLVSLPAHGLLSLDGVQAVLGQEIDAAVLGMLVYQPEPDYHGSDSFQWNASDGNAYALADAPVNLTITPVNDPPRMDPVANLVMDEDAGQQTVTVSGIGAGAPYEDQVLSLSATSNKPALVPQPSISYTSPAAGGSLRFTPPPNSHGTAEVTLILSDGEDETTRSFTVTVRPVNDPPSFTPGGDQSVPVNAGAQSVPGWAANLSAGPADESGQALAFTVTNDRPGLFSAQPAVSPQGTLTYTPAPGKTGSAAVSLRLVDDGGTAYGGQNASPWVTFNIRINHVNHAPLAAGDSASTLQDSPVSIPVLSNDTDSDGDPLAVTGFSQAANGVVEADGASLRYRPGTHFTGTDSFTYTVSDPSGASDTATVTVTVRPVESQVSPQSGGELSYSDGEGNQTVVTVSAQAVDRPVTLVYTAQTPAQPASGFVFAGSSFHLDAYQDGQRLESYQFQAPIRIELRYRQADVAGLQEDQLRLFYWDTLSNQWLDAAQTCSPAGAYERYPDENRLRVDICHLTEFGLFTKTSHRVWLPFVAR